MTNKVKSKSLDGESLSISPERRELHFLEKNLEELSRAHKKVQCSTQLLLLDARGGLGTILHVIGRINVSFLQCACIVYMYLYVGRNSILL